MVLDFDRLNNRVRFSSQQVATNVAFGDTMIDEVWVWGRTNFGNYFRSIYVVDGYMQDENSAVVESQMYFDPENPEYFTNLSYVFIAGDQTYYATDPEGFVSFPATMTRVASAEPAAKQQLPMIQEMPAKRDINPIGLGYYGLLKF
jgi:hypothetical protein